MVEVTGAIGTLAGMRLVSGERESRDGSTMAATSVRSDPRRALLQGVDVILGEGVALLIDLAHGWPRVVEFSGGCKVAADSDKSTNEAGKDSNTEEGESGGVGDHSNEEAGDIGTSENTCAVCEGSIHKGE